MPSWILWLIGIVWYIIGFITIVYWITIIENEDIKEGIDFVGVFFFSIFGVLILYALGIVKFLQFLNLKNRMYFKSKSSKKRILEERLKKVIS